MIKIMILKLQNDSDSNNDNSCKKYEKQIMQSKSCKQKHANMTMESKSNKQIHAIKLKQNHANINMETKTCKHDAGIFLKHANEQCCHKVVQAKSSNNNCIIWSCNENHATLITQQMQTQLNHAKSFHLQTLIKMFETKKAALFFLAWIDLLSNSCCKFAS